MIHKPSLPSRFSLEPRPHEQFSFYVKRAVLAAIARAAISLINKSERKRRRRQHL